MNLGSLSDVKMFMRLSIISASVARQAHDKMAQSGPPNKEDMLRYAEEATSLADMFEEAVDEASVENGSDK